MTDPTRRLAATLRPELQDMLCQMRHLEDALAETAGCASGELMVALQSIDRVGQSLEDLAALLGALSEEETVGGGLLSAIDATIRQDLLRRRMAARLDGGRRPAPVPEEGPVDFW
jgi:hypothetical protein